MSNKIIFRPSKIGKKRLVISVIGFIVLVAIFLYKFVF